MELNPNAPMDQLICLACGQRTKNRHNVYCPNCNVCMVYESAWANLKPVLSGNRPEDPEQVTGQLALY